VNPPDDLDRVNPPARRIGSQNVVFTGTARRHYVPLFAGSVSIKSTLRGNALWESASRAYAVSEGTWLLLGEGQEYTLTIDTVDPVTTFCLFFRRGLVEDAVRVALETEERLLDSPASDRPGRELRVGLRPRTRELSSLLRSMHRRSRDESVGAMPWDELFARAALLVARQTCREEARRKLIAAVKTSTREELARRVQRGLDFMLSHLGDSVTTDAIAREACLSPFHFHRAFAAIYGATPHRYLTRQRLLRAADLLRETSKPIAEVGGSVGFASAASFSALFRREFGRSPREYRSRV
jgi:AraC family transcriptional regulator